MGVLLALLFAPLPAEETPGSIQGKIVDGLDRGPVAGARVEIVGAALSALTDDDGVFRVAGVLARTYRLIINLAGYIPAIKTDIIVWPKRTTHVEAALEAQKPDIRETVEVTASYFQKDEKNPVSAVNLSAEEVRRARDKSFLFGCAGRGGMFGASLFPLTHPTIVRMHNLGALGTSRTA